MEDYVRDHWSEIVNSNWYRQSVNPEEYLKGGYGNSDPQHPLNTWPYIDGLATESHKYPTDGSWGELTPEQRQNNIMALIPQTIKTVGGYIDNIYKEVNNPVGGSGGSGTGIGYSCDIPPDPDGPANDHPDDRFDVSDEFYWEKEFKLSDAELTDLYMRTAIKKGKIDVWYKKQFTEKFFEGKSLPADTPQETKDRIEAEFQAISKNILI